ncbi:EF-hand domain-containing protein D1 isoform X1 [Cricetulus griseus]|uniref:EF-hand domain-containing protein D1 isoform X1 n=1 Tax=Cricetulus griseus TaxID=10029 RepID=UPI00022F6783|nr:EF-hand domain-containing protein D1 isoform X1 [Cricetulus griseus]
MDVTKRSHFSHLSGSQAASSLVGALVEENGTARTVAKLNSLVFATGSLGTTRSLSSPRVDSGDMPGLRDRKVFNPYTEFPEFSRRLLKNLESMFKMYDAGRDGFIDLMEMKLMMEKLGAPQTHLGLKTMIKEVDEDFDGKLNFREFLLIFHKAAAGELQEDSGLLALAKLSEIDVALEGVKGAKNFFEAKAQALSCSSKFEAELKAEQDERKRQEEARRIRQAAFRELKATFSA